MTIFLLEILHILYPYALLKVDTYKWTNEIVGNCSSDYGNTIFFIKKTFYRFSLAGLKKVTDAVMAESGKVPLRENSNNGIFNESYIKRITPS